MGLPAEVFLFVLVMSGVANFPNYCKTFSLLFVADFADAIASQKSVPENSSLQSVECQKIENHPRQSAGEVP